MKYSLKPMKTILGIESSCDETAAAVVSRGTEILSSVVASQIKVHAPFGGVVPELASRKHLESIAPVVEQALEDAGISRDQIDGVAVTRGPGLVGALLVGFSFAKAYAFALDVPWVGVNHLLGHIHSVLMSPSPPEFPFAALLVSGGHTSIYKVSSRTDMEVMGQTRDDAAGEAFDKVSKAMGLGYPGGEIISKLAESGDPHKISFPRSWLDKKKFDFSFSGIKTAVGRYMQVHEDSWHDEKADIAASFQEAVVEVLATKLINAAKSIGCPRVAVAGGVAANACLRDRVTQLAAKAGMSVHLPDISLCGDNAAMIAAAGYYKLAAGERSPLNMDVFSRMEKL
ncbi:O-sialoglycoprotein endopeptidase [Desulfatibacillum alkenivorans DSM 16219]|uniref:tRNA N6-adenosine threonylcarbamoyltransferase n=2 Tax=Desulfatibacillum alkenivorans TaxID=259354 RepID=A0A1M6V858_9BACT|nr:O-sialoglycoprotein endopeptidase [Desulfatibacillum alkenivorans DSM 16219]